MRREGTVHCMRRTGEMRGTVHCMRQAGEMRGYSSLHEAS